MAHLADGLISTAGAYGHSDVYTPHIDELAAESMVFERGYTNYPYCCPSCVRATASLLTARP